MSEFVTAVPGAFDDARCSVLMCGWGKERLLLMIAFFVPCANSQPVLSVMRSPWLHFETTFAFTRQHTTIQTVLHATENCTKRMVFKNYD